MSEQPAVPGKPSLAAFGAVILIYDAPLRWAGRAAQWLRNLVVRQRPPQHGLDATLLCAGPIAYGLFKFRYRRPEAVSSAGRSGPG